MGFFAVLAASLFFVFLSFAALSTVIAVMESIIACFRELLGWDRPKAAWFVFALIALGSIPCVLGFNLWSDVHILGSRGILDTEDFIVSSLILPLGSIIFALFCVTKYGWGFDNYLKEVNTGEGLKMPRWIRPYFKYVLPLLIFIILVRGLM